MDELSERRSMQPGGKWQDGLVQMVGRAAKVVTHHSDPPKAPNRAFGGFEWCRPNMVRALPKPFERSSVACARYGRASNGRDTWQVLRPGSGQMAGGQRQACARPKRRVVVWPNPKRKIPAKHSESP